MKRRYLIPLCLTLLPGLPLCAHAENTTQELFTQASTGDAQAAKALGVRADGGEREAQRALAMLYVKGSGVPKDYRQAVAWFKKAAAQHDSYSQFYLGTLYHHALGVASDQAQAAFWYTQAAEQGMVQAQANLATLYVEQGFYTLAVPWYREAAAKGDVGSAAGLGRLYASGQGVARSYPESCKWFAQAAEAGYGEAAPQLGNCYAQGLGVVRDDTKAALWYQKASDAGDLESRIHLGDFYAQGRGVKQDDAQALALYQQAAQGNPDRLMDVSLTYLGDDVVQPDYAGASIWAGVVRDRARNEDLRRLAEKTEASARQHLSADEKDRVAGRVHDILSGDGGGGAPLLSPAPDTSPAKDTPPDVMP